MKKKKCIAIVSKPGIDRWAVRKIVQTYGNECVTAGPDIVVSYGGDGTFLFAERMFPGVPKILTRKSARCYKCHTTPLDHILDHISKDDYRIEEQIKLEASLKSKGKKNTTLIAANEVNLRNKTALHTLRFSVSYDNKQIKDILGDGVIIATPFGSTAYFHSITRKSFDKGMGIAFNNPIKATAPAFLKENSTVKINIDRGHGLLAVDNNPHMIDVRKGDSIIIKKTKTPARIVRVD